jgi:hypothetical protein
LTQQPLTTEELIQRLNQTIQELTDGTFTGLLIRASEGRTWGKAHLGWSSDRVNAVDFVFQTMYEEPNSQARTSYMEEMFKRWTHYFAKAYVQMMSINPRSPVEHLA